MIGSMPFSSQRQVIMRRLTAGHTKAGVATGFFYEPGVTIEGMTSKAALMAGPKRYCLRARCRGLSEIPTRPKSTNTLSHVKPDVRDRGVRPVYDRHALASEVV